MSKQQINVPSADFWTITPFQIELPEGWTARQTVDHLAYMEVEGEPSTNCGIQWKRVSSELELPQVAAMSHAVTRTMDPNVQVAMSKYGRRHGWMSYLRLSEFSVGEGDDRKLKGQVYSAAFGPSFGPDRPIELFEIIGHFDAANGHRAAEIEAIVFSFRFDVAMRSDTGGPDGLAEAKGA